MDLKHTDNPLRKEKQNKLQKLRELGVDSYPHNYKKLHDISDVIKKESHIKTGETSSEVYMLAGRIMLKRDMGKAAFFNIRDEGGDLQCYIRRDDFMKPSLTENGKDSEGSHLKTGESVFKEKTSYWDIWKLSDIGDIVGIKGFLFRTRRGELSLRVKEYQMLCKTLEPLPEKYHGLEDTELKYRYRHLDLIMNPESKEVFKTRAKIIREIRNFMNKKGFMEVETPVLQPVYGGANASPFKTHHRRLKRDLYLKISPEIYLKKLLVGGFEKVYEIGKNFRNEGIDRTHNPEFTMMEYYEAYTDYQDQMKLFEELVCHITKKIKGSLKFTYQGRELDFTNWEKITVKEGILKYGNFDVDKMNAFELWEKVQSLDFKSDSAVSFEGFVDEALKNECSKEVLSPHLSESLRQDMFEWRKAKDSNLSDSVSEENKESKNRKSFLRWMIEKFNKANSKDEHKWNEWDEYIFQWSKELNETERYEECKDAMIMEAFELTAEEKLKEEHWNPVFITDFPLGVSPLTKKHRKWLKVKHKKGVADINFKNRNGHEEKSKYFRTVERFEPYIAGMEIGNAYTELNDPEEQKKRLLQQQRQENHPLDKNFIHALEVGLPPTGGVGLGIERLVMILTDQNSIKDSLLFPILKS